MKIGSSIFGGIKASQAMKKVEDNLRQQQAENQQWYDQRYNEDATQRADAQRILAMTNESIKNRNRQAAATQAVMGGTEESVAATKAANADAMADAASNIAIAGANRKDTIENQYMEKKANINKQLNDLQEKKAKNITDAVNGVTSAASGVASSLLG